MSDLNQLKEAWQQAGTPVKTTGELEKMRKISHHPTLKKIRKKLWVETILLLFLLIVYYDWFDGHTKPFYANLLLVTCICLYITNDVIGYRSLLRPVKDVNLQRSIAKYLSSVKRFAIIYFVTSFLYSLSLLIFFSSVIHFTKEKKWLLVAMALILFQLMFWSVRLWKKRIHMLEQHVEELNASI